MMLARPAVGLALVLTGWIHPGTLRAQEARSIATLVDSLRIYVEGATGLHFRQSPRYGVNTRQELRRYLQRTFERQLGPERLRSIAISYNLLGLLPDTVIHRDAVVDLYSRLIRGYYDPETDILYAVTDEPPGSLREVLTHEMVHALQDQYLDLEALLDEAPDNDTKTAARAVIEGQATFASLRLMTGGRNIVGYTGIWKELVRFMKLDPTLDPRLKRVPLVLREGLVGPYVYGAQFMSWWQGYELADSMPFGARMPVSTEQILHPDRYAAGDRPLRLVFTGDSAGVIADDVVGELEIHVLAAQLLGAARLDRLDPLGWGGDRYRVFGTPKGPALVWCVLWDDTGSARSFTKGSGARLAARRRTGYQTRLDTLTVAGHPATRYVFAPVGWSGWGSLPSVELEPHALPGAPGGQE